MTHAFARAARTGWVLAWAFLSVSVAPAAEDRAVHRIVIDGPISPATADYVEAAIALAAASASTALILQLDTPGGLLNSTKSIIRAMLASPIPVIVYVAPSGSSATSAGVFVTTAAHVAAMAPGTTIGAAHPVGAGGEDIGGDMRQKVENYAASFVESLAAKRGRNVEWAAKAVRESVSITETEALNLHVVDIVADSANALLAQAEGRQVDVAGRSVRLAFKGTNGETPRVIEIPMTFRQRVLSVIADPNIAYLLMIAGILGVYMEFSTPGALFPGVVGVICLLLALLAGQVLPINSTAVLLVILGVSFLVAETFVPSFGILGFGGIAAITLGSLFLYTPDSSLVVDRSIIATTTAVFSVIAAAITLMVLRDRRQPAHTGAEGIIGERGVAISPIHRDGKVHVHGEIWNARSVTPIQTGRTVQVIRIEGLTLTVEPSQER